MRSGWAPIAWSLARALVLGTVVLGTLVLPRAARAQSANLNERRGAWLRSDGCPRTARAVGPTQASTLDGQLGAPRRACLRDELVLAGDGYLIARPADFYGNIRVGARLSGSYVVDRTIELWGSLELVRYQSLISAVSSSYLGLGYLSLGATLPYFRERDRAIAAYVRLVLPTTTGLDQRSQPLALELGTTAETQAGPNFRFHAWASALGSLAVSDLAPADPRGGVRVGGGVDWVPYEAFSIVLELASGFGYRDALDFLALQGGFRFAFGDTLGVDLGLSWPFAGAEPGLATAQLAVSGRLDGHGW
jgi:hypothetical protein